jgi:serine phosphatase RsbU (regulator of sigma subunit)
MNNPFLMKNLLPVFLLILIFFPLNAQVKTVVHDGLIGIESLFVDDTLTIRNPARNRPADRYGLQDKDKVIEVDGFKVSGAGLSYYEVDNYLHGKAGSSMQFKVKRSGVDSLITINLVRDLSLALDPKCFYEYLVDTSGKWTIHDILRDSIQRLFLNPFESQKLIHSFEEGSKGEELGLKAGDRILGLQGEMEIWDLLEHWRFAEEDSILTILRDSTEIIFDVGGKKRTNLGIVSRLGHDIEQKSIWLKIVTSNRISEDRAYLLDFLIEYDSILVYHVDGQGDIKEKKTGALIQASEKDFILKDLQAIQIDLNENEEQTFYVNIKDRKGPRMAPFIILSAVNYVAKFDRLERIILGAMWGMMIIVALYYLILFIFIKENSYIYHVFFILSFALALLHDSGYASELIWPDSSTLFDRLDSLIISLPVVFFLIFGISYLNLRESLKIWHKIVIADLLLILLLVPVSTIFDLINPYSDSEFLSIIYIVLAASLLIATIILITPAILRIRHGFKPGWYFLSANVIFVALIIYYGSYGTDLFMSDITKVVSNASLHFGVIVQFLLFSLGMGQKIRTTEKEKREAQERIIEQLKENEKLKDKVNRELEEKVEERTREIVQQTAEIEAQRDELERQRDQLSEQQQEILDSINYAQRIQTAVLPPEKLLKEVLPEHFILFKPRDIVSGDFYWIRQIKNFTVVVAADCTGHGVPGAFMSMLGVSFLNEMVSRSRFDSAGEFLDRLRKKVKDTLKQEGREMEQKDGMDMAFAIIDNDSLELQYAGAFNPLYIFRKKEIPEDKAWSGLIAMKSDQSYLLEIKGDRQPIAIQAEERDFTTHHIKLFPGDTIYLFSDGYFDQMGGPKGKKFMGKKFKQLLLSIQPEKMQKQKEILDNTLEEWKGNIQQIDDILVFGIRWN